MGTLGDGLRLIGLGNVFAVLAVALVFGLLISFILNKRRSGRTQKSSVPLMNKEQAIRHIIAHHKGVPVAELRDEMIIDSGPGSSEILRDVCMITGLPTHFVGKRTVGEFAYHYGRK